MMRGINADAWIGLFAPAGSPVVALLQKEIAAAAPELKWSKIIKDAGITLEQARSGAAASRISARVRSR